MRKTAFTLSLLLGVCTFVQLSPQSIQVHAQTAVEAKGECVMEINSRRILYASHADLRLPMASTTKIATAITVLENCKDIENTFSIPMEATGIEGSSVYLKSGEEYSVKDLLYGLMLRSGNDCATALALYCAGSIPYFTLKMNETAQKAGALSTRFENPHGLPAIEHYTTARDLSYITCYAMQNKQFCEIVSTEYYAPRGWKNKNKMLHLYEGSIGVKTGYTKQAGRCLVSAATRNGTSLVCTVLGCPTTYERTIQLLDDAFAIYQTTELLSANSEFMVGEGKEEVKAYTKTSFSYPLLKEEKEYVEIKTERIKNSFGKEKSGDIVGQIQIYLSKRLIFSGNLYKL